MTNNYKRMRMPELKALPKGNGLRGYSKLRKDELIRLICENEPSPPQTIDETMGPEARSVGEAQGTRAKRDFVKPIIDELTIEQPQSVNVLSNRQRKRNAQKASKLKKKSNNLRYEINDLKSQMDVMEEKIKKASSSTSTGFKGKKILSMKRESYKAI